MKWLVVGLSMVPQMGLALSCLPTDLATDYLHAINRAEPFSILIGRINYSAPSYGNEDSFNFSGEFTGEAMLPDGTLMPYRSDVRIDGQCINGDCGWLGAVAERQIVFAYDQGGVLTVPVFPCSAIPTVASDENVTQLHACLTGGACEPLEWHR